MKWFIAFMAFKERRNKSEIKKKKAKKKLYNITRNANGHYYLW